MNIEKLKTLLIEHEDLKLKPYRCTADKLTIGVGRNLDDRGITKEEALYLLDNDIALVVAQLDQNIPWWRNMSESRQLVVTDMCFNLGIGSLLTFKNTLQAMKDGRYEDAAKGMENSLWYKQVGKRAVKLVKMMREG